MEELEEKNGDDCIRIGVFEFQPFQGPDDFDKKFVSLGRKVWVYFEFLQYQFFLRGFESRVTRFVLLE